MKHYIIVETNVTNPGWIPDYLKNVTPMVEKFGGKYLTRTSNIQLLEGNSEIPQFSLIAEFPSKESATNFYNSTEYEPYKKARQKGSSSKFLLVPAEGTNV